MAKVAKLTTLAMLATLATLRLLPQRRFPVIDPAAPRDDLYAITASGKTAELYATADAALRLDQEIRVLRVLTAILFADPEKHHAALVRVLPALVRALDIQSKLSETSNSALFRWVCETADQVLRDKEAEGRQEEAELNGEDPDFDEVPW